MSLTVETSPGELIDKLTILEIKSDRIQDKRSLGHINTELEILNEVIEKHISVSDELKKLIARLKKINEALWDIEDNIRICEKEKNFGDRFIELARSVYQSNDLRAEIKRDINQLLSSKIYEVKSYEDYT